jgi:hypothetical protein
MSDASRPETGQDILGIATTKNDGNKLVRVIFYDDSSGFYHCEELETKRKVIVYRQDFQPFTPAHH